MYRAGAGCKPVRPRTNGTPDMIEKSVLALQRFCFRFRLPILLALLAFTAVMAVFAARLNMSAGFAATSGTRRR